MRRLVGGMVHDHQVRATARDLRRDAVCRGFEYRDIRTDTKAPGRKMGGPLFQVRLDGRFLPAKGWGTQRGKRNTGVQGHCQFGALLNRRAVSIIARGDQKQVIDFHKWGLLSGLSIDQAALAACNLPTVEHESSAQT
ncbi:hypothetical protein [Pseudomonas sp. KCJK8670]|uniref:hypothetical protein n=1 Tax=Pseudomonas sp. KCJK8670 TaxID=3344558 RepID=UPI003906C54B